MSIEPCPLESTNLSLLNQLGLEGLCTKCRRHRTSAISAIPMGMPGCPQLAFCTASAASIRSAFIDWELEFLLIFLRSHCYQTAPAFRGYLRYKYCDSDFLTNLNLFKSLVPVMHGENVRERGWGKYVL